MIRNPVCKSGRNAFSSLPSVAGAMLKRKNTELGHPLGWRKPKLSRIESQSLKTVMGSQDDLRKG